MARALTRKTSSVTSVKLPPPKVGALRSIGSRDYSVYVTQVNDGTRRIGYERQIIIALPWRTL